MKKKEGREKEKKVRKAGISQPALPVCYSLRQLGGSKESTLCSFKVMTQTDSPLGMGSGIKKEKRREKEQPGRTTAREERPLKSAKRSNFGSEVER